VSTRHYLAGLWLLSGLPVGVALIFLPPIAALSCFTLFVLLETGHNLSPIVLAWTNTEFRRGMLGQRVKYLLVPGMVLFSVLVIGTITSLGWTSFVPGPRALYGMTDGTNLLPVAMWIYWPWKIYHFGMQHFGVMRILQIGWNRRVNKIVCLTATAFGMAIIPALTGSQWILLLMMGVFSVNHWVVDIGLSAWVVKRGWLFAGAILLMGAIGFVWMVPTSTGMMIRVIPIIICARLGLGLVHFLYSRWVWKLSDPLVRTTIGSGLLASFLVVVGLCSAAFADTTNMRPEVLTTRVLSWTGQQSVIPCPLTAASSITINFAACPTAGDSTAVFTITLTSNTAFQLPSPFPTNEVFFNLVINHGTGPYTARLATGWFLPASQMTGNQPTLSTTANANDELVCHTVPSPQRVWCSTLVGMTPAANILTVDRDASANWKMAGLQSLGGIPARTGVCATLNPVGGGSDDTVPIQNAINSCGTCSTWSSSNNCVVQLNSGTFTLSTTNPINLNKSVVLRGAGVGATILNRTNGAILNSNNTVDGQHHQNIIAGGGYSLGTAYNLSTDGIQGATSITTSSTPTGISTGTLVLVDELGNGQAMNDCCVGTGSGAVQVWAEPGYRLERNAHNPVAPAGLDTDCYDNSFQSNGNCTTPSGANHSDATAYQMRLGGFQAEYHLVNNVSGNTISFDSPLTMSYRTANTAQVHIIPTIVQFAGVENLTMQLGSEGNLNFQGCVYCWAKGIESFHWLNRGIWFAQGTFRNYVTDYWAHNPAWPVNGGGGYNIALTYGASEHMIENGVSEKTNKVIVAQAAGAGAVVAYNYMDDGYIRLNAGWIETGLNCAHLAGSHHMLFEGNQSFNIDSDFTHGAATYCTYFRNYITGIRATWTGEFDSIVRNDSTNTCGSDGCGPRRAASSHPYTYWTSFIGNILGTSGVTTTGNGWVYSDNGSAGGNSGTSSMLKLGWDDFNTSPTSTKDDVANVVYPTDPRTLGTTGTYATANGCMDHSGDPNGNVSDCTTIVDGNYDYVTGTVHWASNDVTHTLPNSLYLSSKPSFFGSSTWPPYDPITPAINDIPAHARWVSCQPSPIASCIIGGNSIFVATANVTLSNSNLTATNGTTTGSDIQVNDFRQTSGISGQKVYYEMGCTANNGTTGNGGAGYANAASLAGWLGEDNNSAGYVLATSGANNYQAGGVYTAGAWSGCVAGDTMGLALDATVTPMTLAVEVLHSGTWGALSTARNVSSGLTAAGALIPTADVKATGEAYTICGNTTCAATPAGIPSGYVWFDTIAH
jgi:hypothetical protein